jgi:PAS domain S-box-containing protein
MAETDGGRSVLYLDDGEEATTVADEVAAAGFRVVRTETTEGALDSLRRGVPNCIVSEFELPDGDGVEFLRAVRAVDDVPFIMFTDAGDERVASEAVAAGVTEYLPKEPLSDQCAVLVDRVRGALSRTPRDGGPPPVPRPPGEQAYPVAGERPLGTGAAGPDAASAFDSDPAVDPASLPTDLPEGLKISAMDAAPVGITLTDPALPDNPLVYVNDAFERMTGYEEAEVLGRNCRFLQGERTSERAVGRLREAIETVDPVSVELVNYRRDGTPFWNRVDVAPLRDGTGEVTNYVGFQTDVTERKRAERAARAWAAELSKEREYLETLMDRVYGLVEDVSAALVEADSPLGVESRVCDCLVERGPYLAAWFGERAPAREVVTPRAAASDGTVPDPDRFEEMVVDVGPDAPHPAGRTAVTDELTVEAVDGRSALAGASVPGAAGVAAVPVTYGDHQFGVLTVYVDELGVLDRRERVVLWATARATATALNALATQRMLTADAVTELDVRVGDRSLWLSALARRLDCELAFAGSVWDGDALRWFFEVDGAPPSAVEDAAADRETPASVATLSSHESGGLFEFTTVDDPIARVLGEHGARLRDATAARGTASLGFDVRNREDARLVVESLADRYDGVELAATRRRDRPARTRREFAAAVEESLTDRQATALRSAHLGGFFEWPRETDGDELATSMDVSRATFHQHLRAAERKLVDAFYADPRTRE